MRQDLLALSAEDLASISNVGNVKRATREVDRGRITWTLSEEDGEVTVSWSDGPTTVIPADRTVAQATCTCPATTVCRHIVRSVLAYQRERADAAEQAPSSEPWDPGAIDDSRLDELFRGASLARWRTIYAEPPGLVVELVRSAKPTARFHRLGHTVRFLVPHDPRYTRCDCNDEPPCRHVALAVFAFRELREESTAGLIETAGPEPPLAAETVEPIERITNVLLDEGVAEVPKARVDRWRAAERDMRAAGIIWPAEVLNDLVRQWNYYHDHDARFSQARVADLCGELLIRADALTAPDLPIPRLFVRGEERESNARLGQSRLVGLGTMAVVRHGSVDLAALLQDTKSGKVMSLTDTFPDPPPGSPRHTSTFAELARKPVLDKRDFATLGRSQVVIKGGTLNVDHSLRLGRTPASAYRHGFAWEELMAPTFCETVDELLGRMASKPPASLQPRRIGEDVAVLPVAEHRDARFDSRTNTLRAHLVDHDGVATEMAHPYSTRGKSGLERALEWLQGDATLKFVSARVRLGSSGLELAPIALVFERAGVRTMVQPWIDDMDDHLESSSVQIAPQDVELDLISRYRERLADELGNALVRSVRQAETTELRKLSALAEQLGLTTHVDALTRAADGDRSALLELLVVSKLAQELA